MARPKAVELKVKDDYKLELLFDNGEEKIFDLKPYLDYKFFENLKNYSYFNSVKIGGLSIEWPNGEDICPDELYFNSVT